MKFHWSLPNPFSIEVEVCREDLDGFGHVNNAVYIQWLEQCSWAHSSESGLPLTVCVDLQRGMAIRRTEVDYLGAAALGDHLIIGNWITSVSRLRAVREFEIFRIADGEKLLQSRIEYVCINLKNGSPVRFPDEFVKGYFVLPEVKLILDDKK